MGDVVSAADFDCRYIREQPAGNGEFSRFLKSLDVELPSGISLADAVKWKWVTPVLRIEIPADYFTDWSEYPVTSPRKSIVRPEHEWADIVVRGDFSFGLTFPPKGRLSGNWFLHPFDDRDPICDEIRRHAIPAAATPEPVQLADGRTIQRYVDFFPYWQAYRLLESIDAARLIQPIVNTPDAAGAAQTVVDAMPMLIDFSNRKLAGVASAYVHAAPTFEWVSLYRTLLGASVEARGKKLDVRAAARRVLRRIGKTPDELKDELRDVLLTLWKEWHSFDNRPPIGAERHLQQDIKRAVDFIEEVSGTEVDYCDSRWYITDRNPRRWAQLHEALPFEHWLAQEGFARRARLYLRLPRRLRVPGLPTTEAELRAAMIARWPSSYAFRRFLISLHRIHELLRSDQKTRVTFTEHNVVDYMVLGCLVVERMIAERWKQQNPGKALPAFDAMLVSLADELTTMMKRKPISTLFKTHRKSTLLHALKKGDRLPFLTRTPRSARDFVFVTLHNLRVLRNYSAHHDVLDPELSFGRTGGRAMRTIISAVALLLSLPV